MLKIRFKLRETSLNNFYLYCLVRVNQKPAKSAIATGIRLNKKDWCVKTQTITNPSLHDEISTLNQFTIELKETYRFLSQQKLVSNISGDIVKTAFIFNEKPSITLMQAYDRFLERLKDLRKRKKMQLSLLTIKTYENRQKYLCRFLEVFYSPNHKLSLVDESFMDEVYDYGTKVKGHNHNHLMKILQYLKRVVAYSYKNAWIPYNATDLYPIQFTQGKDYNFLYDYELDKIKNYNFFSDTLSKTRDIFIAQCWSGFAYKDFKDFNFQMDTFLYKNQWFISKDRTKTNVGSLLPVFPEFERILKKYNYQLPIYSNQVYNRYLKEVGAIVGIDLKLTTHVARKTAGNLWLNKGIKMEVVSKMLGHKSIKTTERLYAKVHPELVFQETKHLISSPA